MSKPAWIDVGGVDFIGTAAVAAATDDLTIAAHGLNDGDIVMIVNPTGGADGPLISNAVYFVRNATTDTFQLSGTRGSQLKEFASNGSADVLLAIPAYSALNLRRITATWLTFGVSAPFGARAGARPGGPPIASVSGTTWTVHDMNAVLTAVGSGPYVVPVVEESGAISGADSTNPRLDALDLEIQDDVEDASGERRYRVVYTAGTPAGSPSAPALVSGRYRIATVLVPAGGSPSPSIATLGQYTVASGGIIPLRSTDTAPTVGTYEGAYADQSEALRRRTGSEWIPIASPNSPTIVTFTSNGSFVKADYPWAHAAIVEVQGGGGGGGGAAAGNGSTTCASAAGGGGGGYSRKQILLADMASSVAVTVGAAGAGATAGNNDGGAGGTSSFGSHLSATGGGGGQGSAASTVSTFNAGGLSGVGAGGDVNVGGGDGTNGFRAGSEVFGVGVGGNAYFGGGGRSSGATQGGNGLAGGAFGGGGGGGHNRANASGTTNRSGGIGGAGVVIVTLY